MADHHVYAKCSGRGPDPFLQVEFSGSRYRCEKYLRDKTRQGRPTHFNFVSSLNIDRAGRRYL